MQLFAESLTEYRRLATLEVKVGDLLIGNFHPIRIQTMTTTDTMNTEATVQQAIRCIEAGAELVRITAPSKKEAENLLTIKKELRKRGYDTPLVADIHFTPNAAEIAARIVEKVRVNPGNYVDKKKFELIEYTDADYEEEIERIRNRFTPLVKICKEYGTAMRIGTNHGSLSDRIMSRYGDTPVGMVESAMEFLRIAENENFYNIVLSMKSSNPRVMVEAYRLLIEHMHDELGHCYPLHLGVTEAGDGEDGRIKSAIGIGTLLEDGIGDTIRVSLTEDPEFELPVCRDIVKRYVNRLNSPGAVPPVNKLSSIYPDVSEMHPRETFSISNIGDKNVPVVVSDFHQKKKITPDDLKQIGYTYDASDDKWNISDMAADYVYCGRTLTDLSLPGTLRIIYDYPAWKNLEDRSAALPLLSETEFMAGDTGLSGGMAFVLLDCYPDSPLPVALDLFLEKVKQQDRVVLCLRSASQNATQRVRRMFGTLRERQINNPVILFCQSAKDSPDESLIHFAIGTGALLVDGFGNGVMLSEQVTDNHTTARYGVINSIAFGILQATRTRISKTEFISCPSCGRTLFDLQETTAKVRAVTHHLKGLKIAIMGCIVNGPGEMADADFGYVGSGTGKITLYKGKEVVKRNVAESIAVDELVKLLKEHEVWIEPPLVLL